MAYIEIKSVKTGDVLFGGNFTDVKSCLENAVAAGIALEGADLRGQVLCGAALDGARMRGARFSGANMTGANMSEADFSDSDFCDAHLPDACFCFSGLRGCDFSGALFGATDIAGARLSGARFSTHSAFTLNFTDAEEVSACLFMDSDGRLFRFSGTPVVLQGLALPIVLLDEHMRIGPHTRRFREWFAVTNDNSPTESGYDGQVRHIVLKYGRVLQNLIEVHRPGGLGRGPAPNFDINPRRVV